MSRVRKPRAIRPGATIGIAAPCMPVDPEMLEAGASLWRDAGFETAHGPGLLEREGYLAGSDARRAGEFMELVADSRVDAIVCARAGYGADRVIPLLDAAKVREAGKPLVGYSDVTALLLWQERCAGLAGIHGPMLDRGGDVEPAAFASLVSLLCGETPPPLRGTGGGGGRASGRLVGGSLTLVVASLGTSWEIDTDGAILLLEDVGERPYRIDRMLQQLAGAGVLARAAGIGIGAFERCDDAKYPIPCVEDVIADALSTLEVPIVTGLPFGHVRENFPWPVAVRATLDGEAGELRIEEHGVEKPA